MFPEENIFGKKCFSIFLIYLNRKLVPRKKVPSKATMIVLTVHEHSQVSPWPRVPPSLGFQPLPSKAPAWPGSSSLQPSPAWPWAPPTGPTSQPGLVLSLFPRRCLVLGLPLFPHCPAPGWDGGTGPGARPCPHSPRKLFPTPPQGAVNPVVLYRPSYFCKNILLAIFLFLFLFLLFFF